MKFNNLGLALGANLKFYINVSKGLKLKVRKFLELTPTFIEVTGEKQVGGTFLPALLPTLNRVKKKFSPKTKQKEKHSKTQSGVKKLTFSL